MSSPLDDRIEWLEADGLGGFASGTAANMRTRRYHGLLVASADPPTRRFMLVNGVDACVEIGGTSLGLSTHRYQHGDIQPFDALRPHAFSTVPWPRWVTTLPNGGEVVHEVFVPRDSPIVVMSWRLSTPTTHRTRLTVRPLLSGRDYHALHHENGSFAFAPSKEGDCLRWRLYPGVPEVIALSNGDYVHAPDWYRSFLYREEQERGFDAVEDLATPGRFEFDLSKGEAILILGADSPGLPHDFGSARANALATILRDRERARRLAQPDPLDRAADAYVVRRGEGSSIIAGYPWFADWGRDTFIAMRGLCTARGELATSLSILLQWAGAVSEGMLPNRFADTGDEPEYNAVDASLWFIIAAHELLAAADAQCFTIPRADRAALWAAATEILTHYASGTRHGIRMDADGLLACGEPGVQLTWMDARVGDREVTPRIGKPVEVQALWINALEILSNTNTRWRTLADRAKASFAAKFWNHSRQCLFDVVDADHVPGAVDPTLRPNQLLAVGGLPLQVVDDLRARAIVDVAEAHLLTPAGLRSLAPTEPGYTARYLGGPAQRDEAYHQGTVWPWLIGAFVEAWVRVRSADPGAKQAARARFVEPLRNAMLVGGHLPEIADAEPPHTPRGCPFQAWSVGELIRLERTVLQDADAHPSPRALAAKGRKVGARAS